MNPSSAAAVALGMHGASRIAAGREAGRLPIGYFAVCCWVLMLITFSPSGRNPVLGAESAKDTVALGKIAVRLIVCAALSWMVLRQWRSPRRIPALWLLLPWFAFAGWAVLSTYWSPLKSISLGQAGSICVLVLLAFNIAMRTDLPDVEQVLKQLTWGLFAACLILLAIYVGLPEWGSMSRIRSGLMHATNSSATASIGCVLLLASRLLFGWRWSRGLLVPGLLVFGATLILSHNRAAIGVTCLVVVGLAACIAPFWRAIVMVGIGVGGAVYLAADLELGLTESILDIVLTYSARGQNVAQLSKLSGREEMWTAMWDSFWESPWIGHGYFVSSAKGEMYVWYVWTNWTAHNFWLQVLVSTGICGAALMAWCQAGLALPMLRNVFRRDVDWKIGVLVAAVFAWHLVWGLTNESFAGPLQPESVVWFVILGLAIGRLADVRLAKLAECAAKRNRPRQFECKLVTP